MSGAVAARVRIGAAVGPDPQHCRVRLHAAGLPKVIGPFGVFDARSPCRRRSSTPAPIGGLRAGNARARRSGRRARCARDDRPGGRHALSSGQADAARVESAGRRSLPPRRWCSCRRPARQPASSPASTSSASRCSCSRRGHGSSSRRTSSRSASCRWPGRSACRPARRSLWLTPRPSSPAPPMTIDAGGQRGGGHREDSRRRRRESRPRGSRGGPRPPAAAQPASRCRHRRDRHATVDAREDLHRRGDRARADFRRRRARAPGVQRRTSSSAARSGACRSDGGMRFECRRRCSTSRPPTPASRSRRARDARRSRSWTQAQDRFRAGVASTLELVQAQESVASASEQYIASVYAQRSPRAARAAQSGSGTHSSHSSEDSSNGRTDSDSKVMRTSLVALARRAPCALVVVAGIFRLAGAVAARRHRRRAGQRACQPGGDARRRHRAGDPGRRQPVGEGRRRPRRARSARLPARGRQGRGGPRRAEAAARAAQQRRADHVEQRAQRAAGRAGRDRQRRRRPARGGSRNRGVARQGRIGGSAARRDAAKATRASQDLERLEPLAAKDEIPRQQSTPRPPTSRRRDAAVTSAERGVREAEANLDVAERAARAGRGPVSQSQSQARGARPRRSRSP